MNNAQGVANRKELEISSVVNLIVVTNRLHEMNIVNRTWEYSK